MKNLKEFSAQNKDFGSDLADLITLTVVTDFTKQELSAKWDIPVGRIAGVKRLRVSDRLVFFVQDLSLLKGKEFGRSIKLSPVKTEPKAKIEPRSAGESKMARRIESCTIPKWEPGPDGLRAFIDQLDETKNLGYFDTDSDLIYTSLCNSGKPELFSQLSSKQKSSVEEFAKFLDANFGRSLNEKKRRFNLLQQEPEAGIQINILLCNILRNIYC